MLKSNSVLQKSPVFTALSIASYAKRCTSYRILSDRPTV